LFDVQVFGYFQSETNKAEQGNEEISVFTVSKRKTIGEAAGKKTNCCGIAISQFFFVLAMHVWPLVESSISVCEAFFNILLQTASFL